MQWKMKQDFFKFFIIYMKTFIFGEGKNYMFKPIEYSTIFLKIVTISSCFTINGEEDMKNNREKRHREDGSSFYCNKRGMAN